MLFFQLRGIDDSLLLPSLVTRRPCFDNDLNHGASLFSFWDLQHQAVSTTHPQQDALLWLVGGVGRWACLDSDHTNCIPQSCGHEIGSHLCEAKSLKVIAMCCNLPSRLENRNKRYIFLLNLLYLPILFMGYTLPVDITLVNLLLYGQHLPHKYRIEKLYYICVWWNEVLPKLWCGEDLWCSLYLWELHGTYHIPNWVSKHAWLKVQLYMISVTGD